MNKAKLIDLNRVGNDNDMIDNIEKCIDDVIFSDDFKKVIRKRIGELKKEVKNQKVNWTENEQEELKYLMKLILNNNEIDISQKTRLIIDLIDRKINNEIKEQEKRDLKSPKEIIGEIEGDSNIKKYGNITDKYVGKSNYVVIIFSVKHRNLANKDIFGINEKDLKKLVEQNNNIIGIIGELIKKGISSVYSFEGLDMIEVSKGIPGGIEPKDIKLINKYHELLSQPEKNKQKIIKIEKVISYLGYYLLYPEFIFGEELLSYGIDNRNNFQINIDILDFISYFSFLNKEEKNFINRIEYFLNNKKQEYLNKGFGEEYVDKYVKLLRKIFLPENVKLMNFGDYTSYLMKNYYYYKFKKRNEDVIKNLQSLYENTNPNAIMLKFGAAHFSDIEKTGIKKVDEEIIPSLDIKDIKTLLKEKGISFIEITPYMEEKK